MRTVKFGCIINIPKEINMHKLLIKTHKTTGLKYLCYTQKKDHISYTGSGLAWKLHLEEHGYDFDTIVVYESENYDDFKKVAIEKSKEYDIVNSNEWANLKLEEGDGGDTVSKKRWITNGSKDKYINIDSELPYGWKYGRSNCIFNDSKKQSEFAKRADVIERGKSIKNAWASGKMDHRNHSACGVKGDLNPAKRPDVKKKMSEAAISRYKNKGI